MSLADQWKKAILDAVSTDPHGANLQEAALRGDAKGWTETLTKTVVEGCKAIGWVAAAKGHRLDHLPEPRCEYLGIDVTAFEPKESSWALPVAVVELENSLKDDRIAYSLWKLLCIRSRLRAVFCYRKEADAAPKLVSGLTERVVGSIAVADRTAVDGETLIVVGYRNKAETFPYGFFRWWKLNTNTGRFEIM